MISCLAYCWKAAYAFTWSVITHMHSPRVSLTLCPSLCQTLCCLSVRISLSFSLSLDLPNAFSPAMLSLHKFSCIVYKLIYQSVNGQRSYGHAIGCHRFSGFASTWWAPDTNINLFLLVVFFENVDRMHTKVIQKYRFCILSSFAFVDTRWK